MTKRRNIYNTPFQQSRRDLAYHFENQRDAIVGAEGFRLHEVLQAERAQKVTPATGTPKKAVPRKIMGIRGPGGFKERRGGHDAVHGLTRFQRTVRKIREGR